MKAEGRLVLLSASVAGVELLIHDAMKQVEEELERDRRLSEHRKSTEDFSVSQTRFPATCERHTARLAAATLGPDHVCSSGADRGLNSLPRPLPL